MVKHFLMKKLLIPILIIGFYIGYAEQSKAQPNTYILIASVVIVMFGMMKLMSKVPSKKTEDKNGIF